MKSIRCWLSVALAVVGLFCLPIVANAVPILDFSIDPPHSGTASISYAGGAAPLIGTDISVTDVIGLGTPLNDLWKAPIIGGLLSFVTGDFTGATGNTWNFGAGGAIFITGGVDLDKSGVIDPGEPDGALMYGVLNGGSVLAVGNGFKITGLSFFDVKDPILTAFYGLPTDVLYTGDLNLSFSAKGLPPYGFATADSLGVFSGDVTNSPVPEPGTILLLGFGLLSISTIARRRLKV